MSTRVAINGLGRIGRAMVKLVIDEPSFELVAVNDLMDVENLVYLLRYDTVYGRFSLVSSDVIGDPRSSIIDLELTKVVDGDLVKVMSWYDNEWGYANQMLREAVSVSLPLAHHPTPANVIAREPAIVARAEV